MSFRIRRGRESEDGRCRDGDADAVRDDGLVGHVARVLVARVLAADGIAHAVAEMDARIPEADTGESGGEKHFRLRFVVVWVFGRAGEVLDG